MAQVNDEPGLDERLDQIFAARDRADMQPTIDALTPIAAAHPHHPRVLYETGGAYDTAGQEAEAAGWYQRALDSGLAGDTLRRCYLQYGSTLRNLGRIEESLALFARGREQFPESPSLPVFEALTLRAAGQGNAAIASLLRLIATHLPDAELDRYRPAIVGNADHVAGLPD